MTLVTRCDNCGLDIHESTRYFSIATHGVQLLSQKDAPGYGTLWIGGGTYHVCSAACGQAWFEKKGKDA